MVKEKIKFSTSHTFPVTAAEIYRAWLDSDLHSAMTGGKAQCSVKPGDSFKAWNGYISGRNLQLLPVKKIIQSWRTNEFEDADEDSVVEIELEEDEKGCRLTLHHSNIPAGQPDYKQGWREFYFIPMSDYFK